MGQPLPFGSLGVHKVNENCASLRESVRKIECLVQAYTHTRTCVHTHTHTCTCIYTYTATSIG